MLYCELLIENEKALLTYEVRRSAEKLCSLLADDFREIGSSGAYFGLAEVLESLPLSEQTWSAIAQNFECHELSDTIAQVVYQCKILHDSEPAYSLRSSIWRLEDGQWKMVFHQGTKVDYFALVA